MAYTGQDPQCPSVQQIVRSSPWPPQIKQKPNWSCKTSIADHVLWFTGWLNEWRNRWRTTWTWILCCYRNLPLLEFLLLGHSLWHHHLSLFSPFHFLLKIKKTSINICPSPVQRYAVTNLQQKLLRRTTARVSWDWFDCTWWPRDNYFLPLQLNSMLPANTKQVHFSSSAQESQHVPHPISQVSPMLV